RSTCSGGAGSATARRRAGAAVRETDCRQSALSAADCCRAPTSCGLLLARRRGRAVRSDRQIDHLATLGGRGRTAAVDHQFAELDQLRAGDVAAEPQQVGGVYLVVVAEAVGRAQQGLLDLFVQGAALLLEQ